MQWLFPKSDLGQESGLHDAGVETFKGNYYRYLAREILQNSLDARFDPNAPVVVNFQLLEISRDKIPDIDGLCDALSQCRAYWAGDRKAAAFFDKAVQLARAKTVTALRISDHNTTGVVGSDGERGKNWYSLIRCSGSSSKYGGEGGSYGIGKNAPFATSDLRTVLYSTYTSADNHAFQGVAKLVTHELSGGGKAQPVGYLGGAQGESIRTRSEIPKPFRRDERGTDIVILGFKAESTWDEQLERSVLEYFWPAINFGDVEVRIGERAITKDNLSALLEAHSGAEDFTAHQYYAAFLSPTASFDKTLRYLKDVSVRIRTGETELPKRIAMVRKAGMVVYHKQKRCAIPFCGVFLCRNDEGNALLRDMEPPRHDTWDPDFPDKGANRKIEKEFGDYIHECIKQLSVRDDVKILPIPELSRFLPDDDETPEEPFGSPASEEQPPTEGFPATPPAPKPRSPLPVQKMPQRKPMQPDGHSPQADESGETEEGSPEPGGTGGGPAGEGSNNEEGGTGSGGATGNGSSSPTSGAHRGGAHAKPAIPIHFRAYPKDSSASVYALAIHPMHDGQRNAIVSLLAVGDDAKEPLSIRSARLADGTSLPIESGGKIGPFAFPRTGPINLEVELRESRKVAMEVSAHEA